MDEAESPQTQSSSSIYLLVVFRLTIWVLSVIDYKQAKSASFYLPKKLHYKIGKHINRKTFSKQRKVWHLEHELSEMWARNAYAFSVSLLWK